MPSANAPSWLVQKTLKAVPVPAPEVHGLVENDPLAGNRKQRIQMPKNNIIMHTRLILAY